MRDPHLLPLFIFGTLLVSGFAVAIIFSLIIQKQRQVKNRLARQQLAFDYSQSLLNTRIEVQETTLNMVASELHDNIAQTLTGCFMQLAAAATTDSGNKTIEDAKANIKNVIRDVRLLSHSLATGMVERRDLQDAIQAELTRIQTFSNIDCSLNSQTIHDLQPEQKLFLFRIVQEALQNILKHAEANKISISLDNTDDHYMLSIADNGKGFDMNAKASSNSLGLLNMQERVSLLKGQLKIVSAPNKGTRIDILIPLSPSNAENNNSHSR